MPAEIWTEYLQKKSRALPLDQFVRLIPVVYYESVKWNW
jgi:hypothetical protein